MAHRREGQVKPWVTRADLLTALRLPLAAAFPFVHQPEWQLALVGAAADPAAGPRRWQGGHGAAAAHVGGVHRPLSAGAAARLGDRGGRAIRHLGLRPGGRPGARNANAGEGDVMRQVWLAMLFVAGGITPLAAQEFHPPPVRPAGGGGTHIGLFGFGVRGGIDLAGSTQMVFGVTLDAGNLVSPRFRIRPSGEIGFFNGRNSYVGSLEALYRFTGDEQTATPYVGAGFSLAGHQSCGTDPDCPDLWANVVVGFELHYRSRSTGCSNTTGWVASATTDCTWD